MSYQELAEEYTDAWFVYDEPSIINTNKDMENNTFIQIENTIKALRQDYNKPENNKEFNNAIWDAIMALRELKKYY